MILTTTETVPNKNITEVLGIVRGNTVRTRAIGKDILAGFKQIVGGEIHEYSNLMVESREEAFKRMAEKAEELRADAVLNIRFTTSMITQGSAEILVAGTAVKIN